MKVRGLVIVCLFYSVSCWSQVKMDSITLEDYFDKVEQETDFRFFYKTSWIKDHRIAAEFTWKPFSAEHLESLLTSSTLSFFQDGDNFYLLNNQRVITDLPLLRVKEESEAVSEQVDPIFNGAEPEESDIEDRVFRIGNFKSFEKGSTNLIEGIVRSSDGEVLSNVLVYSAYSNTLTDDQGYYEIELTSGKNVLQFQTVGMLDTKRNLMVYSNGNLDVEMKPDVRELETIEVLASREKNIESTAIGTLNLSAQDVKVLPALLGEKDVVRVATLSAGVQNVGEGAAGINVRGGKADQNLFLLDNTTIFNINHFFGFFTILNPDGVSDMELYKNGIPARLGGRLSSIFDIKSREPKTDKLHVNGGLGPVTSKLMVDVPIVKDKLGVMIGGRTTYSDFVLDRIDNSPLANNDVSFHDILVKTSYQLDPKNEFSTTFYYSRDRFQLSSDTLLAFTDFSYSNRLISAGWKHTFSDNLIGEMKVGNSLYKYGNQYDVIPSQAFGVDFSVMESNVAINFDLYKSEKLNYYFGVDSKFHQVNPGSRFPLGDESLVLQEQVGEERAMEVNPYFSAKYQMSKRLLLDLGLRYNVFSALGPGNVNVYEVGVPVSDASRVGSESFDNNERIKTYHGAELRFTSRYLLDQSSSIKFGYNRTRQNHHLLINAASISPTDIWRISGPFIKPQIGDQLSVGYFKNIFGKSFIEVSGELYYKRIQNLLDFRTGAELQFNNAVETDLLQGDGQSYGFELSIKKPDGWLNGWINYTYSRSLIRLDSPFPENRVNGGSFFPTGYDKPHYLNAVVNYKFTNRITITSSAVFSSGIPVTYPEGKWFYQGSENILYSGRNEYRIPNYFRLDLGFNVDASYKLKKWTHSSWTFSIYNVLGRDNVYTIFFRVDDGEINGYEMTVFENPIPTITYNFRF